MVWATRWTSSLTLFSPFFASPWMPALRKYLETAMSVASWDQPVGTSAPLSSKTMEPSEPVMTELRSS